MALVEHTCELCRRTFVRKKDRSSTPRFCGYACTGLSKRAPGDWLQRRKEIMDRARRKQETA